MPIRQPIQTIVHPSDFRDGMYCFALESVLMPHERVGMLTVSTSAGYMLTTSVDNIPKREQTFDYSQQADGSWLTKGTVTVFVAGSSPVDGAVTVRNLGGETVVLTLEAASAPNAPSELPVLRVSQPTLVFTRTSPGRPSFQILTIAQQHTDAPVTLTTDAPEHFQFASDSRPAFSPALTLMPSAGGTYVHVRYTPQKSGLHTGQLLIHNQYGEKTVALEGRSSGRLSVLRRPLSSVGQATLRRPAVRRLSVGRSAAGQTDGGRKGWLVPLMLILAGSLAYAGFTYRHALLQSLNKTKTTTQPTASSPAPATVRETSPKEMQPVVATRQEPVQPVIPPLNGLRNRATRRRWEQPASPDGVTPGRREQTDTRSAPVSHRITKQNADNQVDNQTYRQPAPAKPTQESELEQELNKNL